MSRVSVEAEMKRAEFRVSAQIQLRIAAGFQTGDELWERIEGTDRAPNSRKTRPESKEFHGPPCG